MTRLEMFHTDFDGLRKVLGIRSKKTILAAIDAAYETRDCPLFALKREATAMPTVKLFRRARKERGNNWFSDRNYSFSPHAEEMTKWWNLSSRETNRRYLTMLRKMYE